MTLRVALTFICRHCVFAGIMMQSTALRLCAIWLALFVSGSAFAQQRPPMIPAELQQWQDWVLAAHPAHPCPWLVTAEKQQCQWSEHLQLQVNHQGGRFVYQLQLFADGWVSLPGDVRSWPQQVEANNSGSNDVLAIRDQNGVPQVYLTKGRWQLQGTFRWPQLPQSLTVPEQSGIISLQLLGTDVPTPKVLDNELWLQQSPEKPEQSTDQLQIKIFRLLSDDIPARLTTLLQLEVSGKSRETQLNTLLLPGFSPEALYSDLPALLDDKGQLHLQLSAGQYQVQLDAVSFQPIEQLQLPGTTAPMPDEEIWAFVAKPELRTVEISSVNSLDPSQTQVPAHWQQYPLYAMTAASKLQLTPLQRGGGAASDALRLEKRLWLGFDGNKLTVSDQISGTLHSQARLEVQPGYQLGRVELNDEAQLITRLAEHEAGIEIRQNPLHLYSVSSLPLDNELPVSGWQTSFNEVSWQLNLPPGWTLLAATGADRVEGSVLEQWSLWDIFFVLLFSVATSRLLGWRVGVLAVTALLLSYQRFDAPQWSWLSLLALLALLTVAKGKTATWLKKAVCLNLMALLLILLPFSVDQIRQAIYPQLELSYLQLQPDSHQYQPQAPAAEVLARGAPAAANSELSDVAQQRVLETEARMDSVKLAKKAEKTQQPYTGPSASSASAALLQTDPNARIQTGPAEPAWHWQRVALFWQGPVLAEEQTQLYLVPAWLNRMGNLATVLLLLMLLWQLCKPVIGPGLKPAQLWARLKVNNKVIPPAALLLALLLPGTALLQSSPVAAAGYPDTLLLKELEQRLLQPPLCLPSCSSINSLTLRNDAQHIKLQLQIDNQADTAWLLPVTAAKLRLARLNQANAAIFRQPAQSWLFLPKGRHQLELWVAADEPRISFTFSTAWHQLDEQLSGWRLVPNNSNLNDLPGLQQARTQLALEQLASDNRQNTATTFTADDLAQNLPAYAVLERQLTLGQEWQITSTLRRSGMSQQPMQLKVALLDGETPLTPLPVQDGALALQLHAGQQVISWQSSLKQQPLLQLSSPVQQQYTEIWQLNAAPKWHVTSQGLPATHTEHSPLPSLWRPWPGEQVQLAISQPEPVAGDMLTIQQLVLQQHQGNRSSDIALIMKLNASQAQSFTLPLPAQTELQSVSLDGATLPLTVNQQQLTLQLKPGQQQLQLNLKQNNAQPVLLETTGFSLPLTAANIYLQLRMAPDRWILAVGGPAIGPAILFWGMLAVMLLLAIALPNFIQSPLRRRHWLLLFCGICTVSFWIPLLVTLWLLAISKRGQLQTALQGNYQKLSQSALVLLSVGALIALFSAIPYGLLSAPDMQLVGNGSYQQQLYWYQDVSTQQIPVGWVFSLPLWCYQLAMLLWSLWLATALTRWLPWAWQQLTAGGFWPTAPASPAEPQPTRKAEHDNTPASS